VTFCIHQVAAVLVEARICLCKPKLDKAEYQTSICTLRVWQPARQTHFQKQLLWSKPSEFQHSHCSRSECYAATFYFCIHI